MKDQVVDALYTIAKNAADPRRPQALYELAICSLTNFGYPYSPDPRTRFTWPSVRDGLPTHLGYLVAAAEAGEDAAKAVIKRLFESEGSVEFPPQMKGWLMDAAVSGYVIALEDMFEIDEGKYREALRKRAEKKYALELRVERDGACHERSGKKTNYLRGFFTWWGTFLTHPVNTRELGQQEKPELEPEPSASFAERVAKWIRIGRNRDTSIDNRGNGMLHWAAECGHVSWLRVLVEEHRMDPNCQNANGETPLVLGCKNGQTEAVQYLLGLRDLDVDRITRFGESALHFVWCFLNTGDAVDVIRRLHACGADFQLNTTLAEPASHVLDAQATRLDALPVVPGLAIERIVARNRADLINLFLELGGVPEKPSNGAPIRRMLLWATRLGHPEVLAHVYELARRDGRDCTLKEMAETEWEFEGETLPLEHALALGWVSGSGDGWDTPVEFWRRCCKGAKAEAVLKTIITSTEEFRKCEAVLQWAFDRGHVDFVQVLLECRGEELSRKAKKPHWHYSYSKYYFWTDLRRLVEPCPLFVVTSLTRSAQRGLSDSPD